MSPHYVLLLCFGLCVGQADFSGDGSLPKPRLSVWPSSVVPVGSSVTLRCESSTLGMHLVLRKGEIILDPRKTHHTIEFHLTNLQQGDAGSYTCEYRGSPDETSLYSDVLFLWVTGCLPKPSFQRLQQDTVTTGGNVTLQCHKPESNTQYEMFALPKVGAPLPTQTYRTKKYKVNFTLLDVTVSHTGDYSCVYLQTEPPFWASDPSDPIHILVRGVSGITLVVLSALILLLSAILIYRFSRQGAALDNRTGSSCSSKDPEVVTGSSTSMKTHSQAPDEGPQASRAEEAHQVAYAELDVRVKSEAPVSQTKQPDDSCVYSVLKKRLTS